MHEILKNSSKCILIDKLKFANCKCKEDIYLLKVNNHVLHEDRANMHLCKCYKCNKSLWNCLICSKNKNFCKDSKAAHCYRRIYHKIKMQSTQGLNNNEYVIDEKEEEHLALDNKFIMNIEEDLNNLNFLSDLSLEDNIFKNFIKYFNDKAATKYLVARS